LLAKSMVEWNRSPRNQEGMFINLISPLLKAERDYEFIKL